MNKILPGVIFSFLSLLPSLYSLDISSEEIARMRREEGKKVYEMCRSLASLYELRENETFKDVTEDIYHHPVISDAVKERAKKQDRRFYIFSYPSSGIQVKGFLSLLPAPEKGNLLVMLRGGNRLFGVLPPATRYSLIENMNVIGTTYRGSVGEGRDEFGGEDVADVAALVDYLPEIEQNLQVSLRQNRRFLLGGSRGGMQMFLALARFPDLQEFFHKAVSLSGLLDLKETLKTRPDMKEMFVRDFGLEPGLNEREWIAHRNPMENAEKISKDLPILIMQGSKDIRTSPEEGKNMFRALQSLGNKVEYMEFTDGDHCLKNMPDFEKILLSWFDEG
ncbi:MAG: prolyl oligopeptidase family serine peptidase [Simkaniaceae bacterium]